MLKERKDRVGKKVILCVDDERMILDSLKAELKFTLDSEYMIEICESGEEALENCRELLSDGYEIPLVISDYIMHGMKGDELLKQIHGVSPGTLKIMLTGQADAKAVGNAVNYADLYRYITKPWERRDLAMTVIEAVRRYNNDRLLEKQNQMLKEMNDSLEQKVRDRTEELTMNNERLALEISQRKKAEAILEQKVNELLEIQKKLEEANRKLERLSASDGLTGIPNRREFDRLIQIEWKRSMREGTPLSIILIDIDSFKKYNDNYGHLAGDECIRKVACSLTDAVKRAADFVGRYGGEEFAVVLPGTGEEGAFEVAERIRQNVEALEIPHAFSSAAACITVSLGISVIVPVEEYNPGEFIDAADRALYQAKQEGRNCIRSGFIDRVVMPGSC